MIKTLPENTTPSRSFGFRVGALGAVAACWLLAAVSSFAASGSEQNIAVRRLSFLGECKLEPESKFDGYQIGGLSGLVHDPENEVFLAVSDDASFFQPARFFELSIDLSAGSLECDDIEFRGVTLLRERTGEPFAKQTIDPEGIALGGPNSLFVSSEGHINTGVPPFVGEFNRDGSASRELSLDAKYLPPEKKGWRKWRRLGRDRGVRHNAALESLTLSPSGKSLFTATENALYQDGPAAALEVPSPSRIARFDPVTGSIIAEYLYWTDPVARPATPEDGEDGLEVAGLVELLALSDNRLLALERSFSMGAGNTIRLYQVDLSAATDISGSRLGGSGTRSIRPAYKELLLDLSETGVIPDNIEGIALGPTLPDGRSTLILVSDDNFNPRAQRTQFLAFAWDPRPLSLAAIQGAGHSSPWSGSWVSGVRGVVTATNQRRPDDPDDASGMFAIQESLVAPGYSSGIFVETHNLEDLAPGDEVLVTGRIEESGRPGQLTTTRLVGGRFRVLSSQNKLPMPVRLRDIPSGWVDDDGLTRYEPQNDAIDFFESLEGMRVEARNALVVGATSRFGDCVVVADPGETTGPLTARGGLALDAGDVNPERIVVSARLTGERCQAAVGDRFGRPLYGVLGYDFGTYRLLLTEQLPHAHRASAPADNTRLESDVEHFTIATYNVENLDPGDAGAKLERLAQSIVSALSSPDILALQEIQDENGPTNDGNPSGAGTFRSLIEAVRGAGGPSYEYRQIDPVDGADGGQPGGNIRVGFLINPERVLVVDRGEPSATAPVEIRTDERGALLFPNPGRVAPAGTGFRTDGEKGYQPSRKPLALEVEAGGQRLFLINAHLKSKRGDGAIFGAQQPPVWASEEQRSHQAARIREFVDQLLLADSAARIIVLGDLNDHEFRAPLEVLAGDALVNLIDRLPISDRYTYNYQGNSQVLDHILVTRPLAAVAEVDIVHINTDLAHDQRASDHDPVLVQLAIRPR